MSDAKTAAWQSYTFTDGDRAFVEALAGAIGSVVSTWCFYPLDTLKTRLQASTRVLHEDGSSTRSAKNLTEVLSRAIREEGTGALYDGIGIKTLYSLSQSFVYFYAFSYIRRKWEGSSGQKIGVGASLLAGVIAGWCNVLVTEPLDTIATAKQTRPRSQVGAPRPMLPGGNACSRLVPEAPDGDGSGGVGGSSPPPGKSKEESAGLRVTFDKVSSQPSSSSKEIQPMGGPKVAGTEGKGKVGLYSGLWVSLLLTCNPAIQFTAFEQARRKLLLWRAAKGVSKGNEISAFDAFLLGAACKAFATVLTYPAIRAKVLLQTGRAQSTTLIGTIKGVAARDGPTGLYKGLNAQLLKTVLVAALMLMVKEKTFGAAYVSVAWVRSQAAAKKAKPKAVIARPK